MINNKKREKKQYQQNWAPQLTSQWLQIHSIRSLKINQNKDQDGSTEPLM